MLSALRHVTRREREAIRAEIDGHIEDHMADLLELDYPPELAEERTLSAMGDPAEVGRELNEQYTGWGWVILSRVLLAALVVISILVLYSYPSLEPVEMSLDIRVPIGNDVWYIYAAEAQMDAEGNSEVSVWMSWYDKNPFRFAAGGVITGVDCRGDVTDMHGGGGGKSGPYVTFCYLFSVQEGDPYVTVSCERYGEVYQAQVPISWEGVT